MERSGEEDPSVRDAAGRGEPPSPEKNGSRLLPGDIEAQLWPYQSSARYAYSEDRCLKRIAAMKLRTSLLETTRIVMEWKEQNGPKLPPRTYVELLNQNRGLRQR